MLPVNEQPKLSEMTAVAQLAALRDAFMARKLQQIRSGPSIVSRTDARRLAYLGVSTAGMVIAPKGFGSNPRGRFQRNPNSMSAVLAFSGR